MTASGLRTTRIRAHAFNDAEDLSDTRTARSQALAHALQGRTERELVHHFCSVRDRHPEQRHLCFAGGIALNCIANSRALSGCGFERLHVPPCPIDSGLALSMALYAHHHHLGAPRQGAPNSAFTGPTYTSAAATIARLASDHALLVEPASQESLAVLLCRREVICRAAGRSKCGPRALGNRSILCRPDDPGMRDRLNSAVKRREWYRPFAPMMLHEIACDVLEQCPADARHMTMSARIAPHWRERLVAVSHADASTRPQVLTRDDHRFLHGVLREVQRRTNIPAVLNTSFNRQEPIVETPEYAVWTFLTLPVS